MSISGNFACPASSSVRQGAGISRYEATAKAVTSCSVHGMSLRFLQRARNCKQRPRIRKTAATTRTRHHVPTRANKQNGQCFGLVPSVTNRFCGQAVAMVFLILGPRCAVECCAPQALPRASHAKRQSHAKNQGRLEPKWLRKKKFENSCRYVCRHLRRYALSRSDSRPAPKPCIKKLSVGPT